MADNVTLPGTGSSVATDDIGGVQYQRVKNTWGVDGTATDVTATTPLPTSINASVFQFSTVNVSTTNLAAGASFTGTIEDTRNQPMVSLLVTSDQPMLLTLQQFVDLPGTYPTKSIVRYIPANQGLQESIPINGNYFRVVLQNVGSATTTTLNLNTAFGTIPSADSDGRSPVSLADGATLLLQTLTTATTSTVIDTSGYGSVAVQLSGNWTGSGYFESSNDYTDTSSWVPVLVLGSDPIGLQDIVNGDGLYSVNPSGRYLRLKLVSVSGSCIINAVGRAGKANSGADVLSLAMDRQNNAPMHVAMSDTTLAELGNIGSDEPTKEYIFDANGVVPLNSVLFQWDCRNIGTIAVHAIAMGTTLNLRTEVSGNGVTWNVTEGASDNGQIGSLIQNGQLWRYHPMARYFRIIASVASTTGATTLRVTTSRKVIPNPVQLIKWSNQGTLAGADAYSAGTLQPLGSIQYLFNGATWDRQRCNFNTTTGDTGAKTASFAGATQTNYNATGADILIVMGTVSGTTPTLAAQLQGSADGGTTWYDIAGAVTPSITATGNTLLSIYPGATVAANATVSRALPRTWRLNYVIGGTTPSFTITAVQVAYLN